MTWSNRCLLMAKKQNISALMFVLDVCIFIIFTNPKPHLSQASAQLFHDVFSDYHYHIVVTL